MGKTELRVINGTKAMMDVEKMLNNIRNTCQKVEKATDAYKNIIEEVYILYLNRVHKDSGLSFVDYMNTETGMGNTTCKSLVAIQKHIEYEVGRLEAQEEASNDDVADYRGFMKTCTMRELLMMAKNEDITTEYVVLHAFNIYVHSQKKDRTLQELLRQSLDLAKDKYVKLRHESIEEKKVESKVVEPEETEEGEPEEEEEHPIEPALSKSYTVNSLPALIELTDKLQELYADNEHAHVVITW